MCMCTMGVSAPSLHRESSDLIYVIYMYVDLEKDSSLEKLRGDHSLGWSCKLPIKFK